MIKTGAFVIAVTDEADRTGDGALVFFGELVEYDRRLRTVNLRQAHKSDGFDPTTEGVGGAASVGPIAASGTKISNVFPQVELTNVAYVVECTQAAVTAWQAASWTA